MDVAKVFINVAGCDVPAGGASTWRGLYRSFRRAMRQANPLHRERLGDVRVAGVPQLALADALALPEKRFLARWGKRPWLPYVFDERLDTLEKLAYTVDKESDMDNEIILINALPIGVLSSTTIIYPIDQEDAREVADTYPLVSAWGHANSVQAVAKWLDINPIFVQPTVERPTLQRTGGRGVLLDGKVYRTLLVVTPLTASRPAGELDAEGMQFAAYLVAM